MPPLLRARVRVRADRPLICICGCKRGAPRPPDTSTSYLGTKRPELPRPGQRLPVRSPACRHLDGSMDGQAQRLRWRSVRVVLHVLPPRLRLPCWSGLADWPIAWKVPIAAADQVSTAWIQRAFCTIHHPLCPCAPAAGGFESERSRQDIDSSGQETDKTASGAAREGAQRLDENERCEVHPSSPVRDGRACAQCPEQLEELYVAVADSEGSVLVYGIRRTSKALLDPYGP